MMRSLLAAAAVIGTCGAAVAADEPPLLLSLPVDCDVGKTCFVQKYVDVDPSPAALDYACNQATNDGHTGTDIRLRSTAEVERGVDVLAAAEGTVKAVRDGMPDRLVSEENRSSVEHRECGNGVMYCHADGWQTKYCHMREDSIAVEPGQTVRRGDRLGQVGYSGLAQFPHLHMTVRLHDEVIDPFTGKWLDGSCKLTDEGSMWDEAARAALVYRSGELIEIGFSPGPVSTEDVEVARFADFVPGPEAEALVVYGRFVNLQEGDRIRIVVDGPGGELVSHVNEPLDRAKAHYVAFAGKRRPDSGWEGGEYSGRVEVIRDGKTVISGATTARIDAEPEAGEKRSERPAAAVKKTSAPAGVDRNLEGSPAR